VKKPSLQFSVPCLGVDETKGPPSFLYIFYELPFPKFPSPAVPFFINNGWCNGLGRYEEKTRIIHPDKRTIFVETGNHEFTLNEETTPFMSINFYKDMVFPRAGTYWIQVFLDNQLLLEYPLVVREASVKNQ